MLLRTSRLGCIHKIVSVVPIHIHTCSFFLVVTLTAVMPIYLSSIDSHRVGEERDACTVRGISIVQKGG